jgi:hypothetical protein
VLAGWLLLHHLVQQKYGRPLLLASAAHLFNPIVVGVSTRGNSEALTVACILGTLASIEARTTRAVLAGFLLSTAVHLRVFPVIFVPAAYWAVSKRAPVAPLLAWPTAEQSNFLVAFLLGLLTWTMSMYLLCVKHGIGEGGRILHVRVDGK